jgi:hydrogenase maturation protein HypF
MTSGNLSEEPIVCDNDEALARLGGIADLFLLHDRDIVTRWRRLDRAGHRGTAGRVCAARAATCRRPIAVATPFDAPCWRAARSSRTRSASGRGR